MSWAESAAPDAADLQDRPARFATVIVGSVGADSNADGASMEPAAPLVESPGVWCLKVLHAVDAPPLTPPYNATKLLADTSLDRRRIAGIAARSPAEHANSNPGCACQAPPGDCTAVACALAAAPEPSHARPALFATHGR